MKIVILGGGGLMGSGTVLDLVSVQSKDSGIEEVIVADNDIDAAKKVVKAIDDPRLSACRVDVKNKNEVISLLEDTDVCINGVPTFLGLQMDIFNYCLEAGVPYIDYGGMGVYTEKQKAEHEKWVRAGLPAILGLGADPGMSNIICRAVADELDTIESINLFWAAKLEGPENPVLVPAYSPLTLLAEFAKPSKQFYKGSLIEMPPQSGKVTKVLPEPFGEIEFMHSMHSEPLTVPFAKGIKEKGIQEFTWRLHLPEHENNLWKSLVSAGFGDFDDPVEIRGTEVLPGEFLEKIIKRNIERNASKIPEQTYYEIHFAVGKGMINGKKAEVQTSVFVYPDPLYDAYNDAGTSMNCSIGAQILAKGLVEPGVWGPEECLDVRDYFKELRKRKFEIETRTTVIT